MRLDRRAKRQLFAFAAIIGALGADLLARSDEGEDRNPETLRRFQELHEQVQRQLGRTESK
jgi:hypothetical protein